MLNCYCKLFSVFLQSKGIFSTKRNLYNFRTLPGRFLDVILNKVYLGRFGKSDCQDYANEEVEVLIECEYISFNPPGN